ncbi:reverse transcriptase [Cucumis melo var. makuwa]|uniref:Reverse transcriptase n=1 Tax=Cucumis melo var. makuwa TaxID=1194695 RepID=A0A5D3DEJ2_CUCMM|nr:reverse transcriptase [Cucumis melo var. makuwa]TYK22101.1 reverse transcriptase [Cucumis melo var. makuwa]
MDYRKLNVATKKDHFPLSFIDQIFDRLAGKEYYYFLDGYLGYNHITIAIEDQHKTTFTYPYGTFAFHQMPFGLCYAPWTFQRCMMAIFSNFLKRSTLCFYEKYKQAFKTLKGALTSAIRAILGQKIKDKVIHHIYYTSKTLNESQENYTTTEKELLTEVFVIETFKSYIVGFKVTYVPEYDTTKILAKSDEAPYGGPFGGQKTVSKDGKHLSLQQNAPATHLGDRTFDVWELILWGHFLNLMAIFTSC